VGALDSGELSTGRRLPHAYQLYGLGVRSQWPLPWCERSGSGPEDVELYECPAFLFSAVYAEAMRDSTATRWFQHARLRDGSTYLRWSGLFEFLISADGRRIGGRPLHEASHEAFHTYLLGQVLSFALVKQGTEPLHSTAVVTDGVAVGFIGDSGYGKSSLGAVFLQGGHPLLTDDLLVLKHEGKELLAYPGPPRIKLFPEIARHVLGGHINGTPMHNLTPKLIIPLDRHLSYRAPAPLKALYVITPPAMASKRESVTIRRPSRRRAFLELLRNSFNTVIVEPERLRRQFVLAARVASEVPIKLLSYPRVLTSLPSVREAILSDLTR